MMFWISLAAEKLSQSIANFGNVDAKCGLVNKVENFDSVTQLKVQRSIAQIYYLRG